MILGQLISANGITGRRLVLVMEKLYVYCDTETEFLYTIDIHFFLKVINFYLFASVGFIIFIPANCIYSGQSCYRTLFLSFLLFYLASCHSTIAPYSYIGLGLSCVR